MLVFQAKSESRLESASHVQEAHGMLEERVCPAREARTRQRRRVDLYPSVAVLDQSEWDGKSP